MEALEMLWVDTKGILHTTTVYLVEKTEKFYYIFEVRNGERYGTERGIDKNSVIGFRPIGKEKDKEITCFDCKYHLMSDCYLECYKHNRLNNKNICNDFEQIKEKKNEGHIPLR